MVCFLRLVAPTRDLNCALLSVNGEHHCGFVLLLCECQMSLDESLVCRGAIRLCRGGKQKHPPSPAVALLDLSPCSAVQGFLLQGGRSVTESINLNCQLKASRLIWNWKILPSQRCQVGPHDDRDGTGFNCESMWLFFLGLASNLLCVFTKVLLSSHGKILSPSLEQSA